jgi:hypothetical protein
MFVSAKLAVSLVRVKPEPALAARNQCGRIEHKQARAVRRGTQRASTSTIPTAWCGPACRVVWEGPDQR